MYWNVSFVFLSIIILSCSAAVEANDDFCRNHKDLVSLPTDYNSLLEPKPNVVVNNDIKLLNIIKVTFKSLFLLDETHYAKYTTLSQEKFLFYFYSDRRYSTNVYNCNRPDDWLGRCKVNRQ